jgi:hypothetical protein
MNNNIQHISNRNQWYQPCFISSGMGMLYIKGIDELS